MNQINYEEIDPEIRDIVRNFNIAGYETTQSCQGHYSEDEGTIIPYIRFKRPNDATMTSFVINNLTKIMHVNMLIPIPIEMCIEKEYENGEIFFNTDLDRFMTNITEDDFEIGIYLNSYLINDVSEFLKLRKLFLKELYELSMYLIKCVEVYKECC